MEEDFFEAAIRHWYDGKLLEEEQEYDNAVCMQGFAAECALKKILLSRLQREEVVRYGHNLEVLFQDLQMLLTSDRDMISILDPAAGFRLSKINLSAILFENHPDRRYYSDGKYSSEDARVCRECAEVLLAEMCRLYIDGYIIIL